jgi:putative peptidoglycan lipid II flippase
MSEQKQLFRSSSKISLFIFISRLLGFVRDMLAAALFGTSMIADAFVLAFRVPNLLRRLFGEEGTLNAAFIPVYAEQLKNDPVRAARLVHNLTTILALVVTAVMLIGMATAPWIIKVFAYGWHDQPEKVALTVRLTQILFPYILFITLTSLMGAVLNSHRYFAMPALSPVVLNVVWISGLAVFGFCFFGDDRWVQIQWVSAAIVVGGVGQFLLQFPVYRKVMPPYRWVLDLHDPAVRTVFKLVLPGIFGLAVTEINMTVDTIIASFLSQGSITALQLGNRLMLLPLGVFGVALATALLPTLARHAANQDHTSLQTAYHDGLGLVFYILMPLAAFLVFLSMPFIRLVYEHGNFNGATSTPMTACALLFYAVGLFAYGGLKITVQVFYSLKDTTTPVRSAFYTMLLNVGLNIVLMLLFEKIKPGYGLGGLALATALSATFNLTYLTIKLKKKLPGLSWTGELRLFVTMLLLALAVGTSSLLVYTIVGSLLPGKSILLQIIRLGIATTSGLAVWVAISYLLKIKELRSILSLLKR